MAMPWEIITFCIITAHLQLTKYNTGLDPAKCLQLLHKKLVPFAILCIILYLILFSLKLLAWPFRTDVNLADIVAFKPQEHLDLICLLC